MSKDIAFIIIYYYDLVLLLKEYYNIALKEQTKTYKNNRSD